MWEFERKMLLQMEDIVAMHAGLPDGAQILFPPYAYDPKIKPYPKELIESKDLEEEF